CEHNRHLIPHRGGGSLQYLSGLKIRAHASRAPPKLLKIENFTIEDDPGGAILVENRLVPTREIDDAEPPHTERAAALDKGSLIIRAPVNDGLTHAVDQGRLDGFSRGTDNASYSAHGSTSRSYGCVIDVARVERRRL